MDKYLKLFYGLLLAVSALLVTACDGDSDTTDMGGSASYSVRIESQEENAFDDARIKVRLYGTARNVADNAATVISEQILDIDRIPSTIDLRWPENSYQLIDTPPVSTEEQAIYYLSIEIDANDDGVICRGDFIQDYTATPFFTMANKPSDIVEFYVIATSNEDCRVF